MREISFKRDTQRQIEREDGCITCSNLYKPNKQLSFFSITKPIYTDTNHSLKPPFGTVLCSYGYYVSFRLQTVNKKQKQRQTKDRRIAKLDCYTLYKKKAFCTQKHTFFYKAIYAN